MSGTLPDPVVASVRRAALLTRVGVCVVLAAILVSGVVVAVLTHPLLGSLFGMALFVVAFGQFVWVSARSTLVTAKSPREVRREFAGPESPLLVWYRARADDCRREEGNVLAELSGRLSTRTYRYELVESGDRRLATRLSRDDQLVRTSWITVRADGDRTRVMIEEHNAVRSTLYQLVQGKLLVRPTNRRIYERLGYEFVETDTKLALRGRPPAADVE